VHRDLKPENIMIIKDQDKKFVKQIKIIDFGFSCYLKSLKEDVTVQALCGTPNYIAPELLRGEEFDFKIDSFALGVIMYLMLRGALPFDSPIPDEILNNTRNGDY